MSDTDLKEKEQEAGAPSTGAVDPKESLSDEINNFISEGLKERGLKGKLVSKAIGNKQLIGGGAFGTIIGVVIALAMLLQGPMQLLHFSKLLQRFHFFGDSTLMNSRAGNLLKYRVSANDPNSRNLSWAGNKLADAYETRLKTAGVEPGYEGRRLRSFVVDPDTDGGRKMLQALGEAGLTGTPGPDGKIRVDLPSGPGSARQRRILVNGAVDTLHLNKVTSVIGARVLKVRAAVDFHPLKNITRGVDESIDVYRKRVAAEKAEARANGVDTRIRSTGTDAAAGDANGDGTIDPTEAGSAGGRDAAAGAADEISGAANAGGDINARSSAIKGKLTRGVGVAGAAALVCGLYALGEVIHDINEANITKPLMRIGVEHVAMGAQISTLTTANDLSLDEIGAATAPLYDEETGTSWTDSRDIQAEMGKPQTGPELTPGARPGQDGPAFFNVLSDLVEKLPGGPAFCGAVAGGIGGWLLDGAGWALTATGPFGFALNAATDVATGAVVGLYIDDFVRWLAGEQTTLDAAGALLGSQANFGSLLAANEAAIAHGAVAMTPADGVKLNMERDRVIKQELSHKSLFARYLSPTEPDSAVSKIAFETTALSSPSAAVASLSKSVKSPASLFTSAFTAPYTKKVLAAEASYDYGFAEYGFTLEEIEDDNFEDPYTNAEAVEPNLTNLNEQYGEPCFGTTVHPTTFKLQAGTKPKRYRDIDPKCNNPNDANLKKYRYYLADLTAAKALVCYESIDEATCDELGVNNTGGATAAAGVGALGISPDGFVFPLKTTKSTITTNTGSSSRWCFQSQGNCHHDYPAADIFAPTGTEVVAARAGVVSRASDNDGSRVGSRVTIKGDDGNLYYYAHMGEGTIVVRTGDRVAAGQTIGRVGTSADAVGTDQHIHFDLLPASFTSRPPCSGSSCTSYPFINPQPVLILSFSALP